MGRSARTGPGAAVTIVFAFVAALAAGAPQVGAQEPDAVAAGRQVFEADCAMCHGRDASGMMGMHPSLRGAVERLTREGVEVTIRNGRDTQPPMPAFEGRLTDDQIGDVIAYVESLPEGPRNFGPAGSGAGGMMGGASMVDGGGMVMGGLGMVLMVVLLLALVVLAVAAIVWVVRQGSGGSGSSSPARAELDRRYASGELNRDEYLERRRDLET